MYNFLQRVQVMQCARARCKTCPFIRNVEKISGPKRSIKITDRFTCISANVIYCITCTLCKKLYDFSLKSEEMCNFFNKRGYPASVVEAGHHRAQQIDRQSALQTSQRDNNDRIPFTLTFHPHNHAVKSIILKNFKIITSK